MQITQQWRNKHSKIGQETNLPELHDVSPLRLSNNHKERNHNSITSKNAIENLRNTLQTSSTNSTVKKKQRKKRKSRDTTHIRSVLKGSDGREHIDANAEDGSQGRDEAEASADDQERVASGSESGGSVGRRRRSSGQALSVAVPGHFPQRLPRKLAGVQENERKLFMVRAGGWRHGVFVRFSISPIPFTKAYSSPALPSEVVGKKYAYVSVIQFIFCFPPAFDSFGNHVMGFKFREASRLSYFSPAL